MAWHKNKQEARTLVRWLDRPLAFHRALVDIPVVINGKRSKLGILGALMLSQAIYWQLRTNDEEGWFYKSREEWESETGMSRREQETARRRLKATSFWHEERRGFPKRLYYRVDLDALEAALRGEQAVGTNASDSDETSQPVGTDAPNRETDQPVGTDAPIQLVQIRPSVGTNAPISWRESAHPVGANAPNSKEGALKVFKTKTTSETTPKITTTTTNARARLRDAAVAVVAVADLPAKVKQALKDLGWVGDAAEIARAWAENPDRVRAWLDYARLRGWSAALLRHTLRTDPGMPPQERPLAGWEAFAENIADAGPVTDGALAETEQEVPAPQPPDQIPPNVGTPPPVPENATPDMGVEPPVPPPRAPDIGSDAASVPPDVRRWWQTAVGQLRYEMPKASFDTWVAPARPVKWRDGDGEAVLTVGVANDYARRWLEERVAKVLSRYVSALAGRPVTLEVTVG